jgi:NADH:ubiquinone oxidoreductase subunit 4 (subunit M)
VDGLSLFFIILTTTIIPLTLLSGTPHVFFLQNIFISCFLVIELFLIIAFSVLDLFYFFIFFEAILIPMYVCIGL